MGVSFKRVTEIEKPAFDRGGYSSCGASIPAMFIYVDLMTRLHFIHRGLKARYLDHRAELSALLAGLSPRDVVVDVGAHKGRYLWSLSRAVPKGRAIAFEPQPFLASYLLRACRSARLENVVVEAVGVSGQSGKSNLAIPGGGKYLHGASLEPTLIDEQTSHLIEVPTTSLDDYFSAEKSKIGAIKIDVEGHEMQVLKGAERLIRMHRPEAAASASPLTRRARLSS
jgi:FkbM family methyltransferase